MMNAEQIEKLGRLADAARKLAGEIEDGRVTGDIFGVGQCNTAEGPVCAFGHALWRAGLAVQESHEGNEHALAEALGTETYEIPSEIRDAMDNVANSNDVQATAEDGKGGEKARLTHIAYSLRDLASTIDEGIETDFDYANDWEEDHLWDDEEDEEWDDYLNSDDEFEQGT